jgi:L-aminopeptidase/D-esterase-like protein
MKATLGPGFRVGHWTDTEARTGCTVVLPPKGNVTSCDIRGSGPGSRELILLDTKRRLTEVHGIVLTGGSAFGLASADGAMRWLAEHDIGYETRFGLVPIVPAAVIYDLGEGRSDVRPGQDEGRAACDDAQTEFDTGRVGAGTGATVGKWGGREAAAPGGLGAATASAEGHTVQALAVVNAVGDVLAADGSVLAGSSAPGSPPVAPDTPPEEPPMNTVLVVATVTATLEKREVQWLAQRASDGITISVRPAHTRYDGDVAFAVAVPGEAEPELKPGEPTTVDILGPLVTEAVARAVRAAVGGTVAPLS